MVHVPFIFIIPDHDQRRFLFHIILSEFFYHRLLLRQLVLLLLYCTQILFFDQSITLDITTFYDLKVRLCLQRGTTEVSLSDCYFLPCRSIIIFRLVESLVIKATSAYLKLLILLCINHPQYWPLLLQVILVWLFLRWLALCFLCWNLLDLFNFLKCPQRLAFFLCDVVRWFKIGGGAVWIGIFKLLHWDGFPFGAFVHEVTDHVFQDFYFNLLTRLRLFQNLVSNMKGY